MKHFKIYCLFVLLICISAASSVLSQSRILPLLTKVYDYTQSEENAYVLQGSTIPLNALIFNTTLQVPRIWNGTQFINQPQVPISTVFTQTAHDSLIGANKFGKTTIVVYGLSDFPAPVAGLITLVDSTTYWIKGIVNIGTNRIQVGTSTNVTSSDRFNNRLKSTTTGNMFEITKPLLCYKVGLECPNGTMFNGTNAGLVLDFVFISNTKNVGTFTATTGNASVAAFKSNFIGITNNGFVFSGGTGTSLLRFFDNIVNSSVGTFINLGTSISSVINIGRNIVTTTIPNTFLSGVAAGVNVIVAGSLNNNIFSGGGTYISTITETDLKWNFLVNVGIANSPIVGLTGATGATGLQGVPGATGATGATGAVTLVKAATQSVTLSTVFVNDAALTTSITTGSLVHFEFGVYFESASAAPDIKFQLAGPTGIIIFDYDSPMGTENGVIQATSTSTGQIAMAAGIPRFAKIRGSIIATSTANLTLQWAQNASNANPTAVKAGSYLIINKQ